MANQIALDLLNQAKQYLIDGNYAEAAKAASGVIALDVDNLEAKDILTASNGASAVSNTGSDTVSTTTAPAEIDTPREKHPETVGRIQLLRLQINAVKSAQDYSNVEARILELVDEFPGDEELTALLKTIRDAQRSSGYQKVASTINAPPKRKSDGLSHKHFWLTLVLCIFFGGLGAHRFYAGKIGSGIFMFLTLGGFGFWVLFDLILILGGNFRDDRGLKI